MFVYLPAIYLSPLLVRWGLGTQGFGVSTVGFPLSEMVIDSLPRWHITFRPSGAFRGWCAVCTLQTVLFKQALSV